MANGFERLFFALWPDPPVRDAIVRAFNSLGEASTLGHRVRDYNLHMTLHFLGNVASERIDCFLKQASRVRGEPFALTLTCNGYFRKPRVHWLGLDDVPGALVNLHRQLGQHIGPCGYTVEHRAYTPHVTLARKVRGPVESCRIDPVHWPIDRFVLVQSESLEQGVRYRVRESFQLMG